MFRKQRVKRGGFALISVIWTLAVLSLIVASFTLDAYMEMKSATYVRQRHQASALLDSGLTIAEMLMVRQDKITGSETTDEAAKDRWIMPATRLKRGQRVEVSQRLTLDEEGHWQFMVEDVATSTNTVAEAEIWLSIEPEPARWNINTLTKSGFGDNADLIWERILTVAGVPEEDQSALVDSFYDWVDSDSITVSSEGAESDYYESLSEPYTAKNGPLDTVGELLYIKGFDRNNGVLLTGGVWNPEENEKNQIQVSGIASLFTTYGTGKINVNAAPREVLLTVPALEDSDGLLVDTILEEREGLNAGTSTASSKVQSTSRSAGSLSEVAVDDYHFTDLSDLTARVPGITQADASTYLSVDMDIYKLEIEGRVGNIKRRVTAIVQRGNSDASKSTSTTGSGLTSSDIVILRWQEEM